MYYLDFSWTAAQTAGGTLAAGVWPVTQLQRCHSIHCRVYLQGLNPHKHTRKVLAVKVLLQATGEGELLGLKWSRMFRLGSLLVVNC